MDITLTGLIGAKLFVFLDDIVIFADILEEHEKNLNNSMQRLRKANLHLQGDKCEFLRPEIGYSGHIIDKNGVRPDPKKIIAVKEFPVLKKDTTFIWTDKQQIAFDISESKLCEEPLLKRPDFSQSFVLTSNASVYAIVGILSQGKIGKDKPIAYASHSLSDIEGNTIHMEKKHLQ